MQRTNSMLIVSTKSKNFNPTNLVYYLKLNDFPLNCFTEFYLCVGLVVHRIVLLGDGRLRLQL